MKNPPVNAGAAAAAAKSLQSCPTLCDPIDGSPPGSPVPGILQARTLEWVAISFSNAWKWKWSCFVVSDSLWPHGLQPTRLLRPWDFPGKSTGVGCYCLLHNAGDTGSIPGATKPVHHNYWICALEPTCLSYWSPRTLQPMLCNEKPPQWETRALQLESGPESTEDPAQPKINKIIKWKKKILAPIYFSPYVTVLNFHISVIIWSGPLLGSRKYGIIDNSTQAAAVKSLGW